MIDAVGYQSRDDTHPDLEKPTQVLEHALKLVNPTGSIGIIGVYIAPDPGAASDMAKQGIYAFPVATLFEKGITL